MSNESARLSRLEELREVLIDIFSPEFVYESDRKEVTEDVTMVIEDVIDHVTLVSNMLTEDHLRQQIDEYITNGDPLVDDTVIELFEAGDLKGASTQVQRNYDNARTDYNPFAFLGMV